MTTVKIKPSGNVEPVNTSERGKEKENAVVKKESLITRMIGIIIMDVKCLISGKQPKDYEIQNQIDQWRKETRRKK